MVTDGMNSVQFHKQAIHCPSSTRIIFAATNLEL